ncbi:hypothetical protein Daus18300_009148 [Diaporthe australafricana]|uniref:Uncharacterized protein n=1 Tax=Diaporthe australafricana TaxID=127596 RepID=A0ABR3WFH7_9PEZI
MSGSGALGKRKRNRKGRNPQGPSHKCENEDIQPSKRVRHGDSDKCNSQPSIARSPDPGRSPMPIQSDIGVATRSMTAKRNKAVHFAAFDHSPSPGTAPSDAHISETQFQADIHVLKDRLKELEEERDDYHDSLHKETEKARKRGEDLLILQTRTATIEQGGHPDSTRGRQSSQFHRDGKSDTHWNVTRRRTDPEQPTDQRSLADKRKVPENASTSDKSPLECRLQQQVDDLSARLSEAQAEVADRVSQILKLFKYKKQDEKFAAQSLLVRTLDCKIAQRTTGPTREVENPTTLLQRAASEEPHHQKIELVNCNVGVLQETNIVFSEKLRDYQGTVARLQTEVRELRAKLRRSTNSRDDEVSSILQNASECHSREITVLEDRIRGLESDVAQSRMKIEQFGKRNRSMRPPQNPVQGKTKELPDAQFSKTLIGKLQSLGCLNRQLVEEKKTLVTDVSNRDGWLQRFNMDLTKHRSELRDANAKIKRLQKLVESQEASLQEARAKIAQGVEVGVKELSESHSKASAEVPMEHEKALQRAQERIATKIREVADAEAEIARLRPFEHAVAEHDRAMKNLGQGREELSRQLKECMKSLDEAREQVRVQKTDNRALRTRKDALKREVQEQEAVNKEYEARVSQFLLAFIAQIERQIETIPEETGNTTETDGANDTRLKQLEDRLQKKLDRIEHELRWYREQHSAVWNEHERLEQWRAEMVNHVVRMGNPSARI